MKRASGILLPIFSLPSEYGIGCFSKEAYQFVDMLKQAAQSYWQILPLAPTGYGDTPYQYFSTYAGNPYFIDLETLVREGLLTESECREYDFGGQADSIDYERIYKSRFTVLKKAYDRFRDRMAVGYQEREAYERFVNENAFWLDDYSLYMAVKDKNSGVSWNEWDTPLKNRDEEALAAARDELAEEISFYKFQQYEFDCQWKKLHAYANEQGVKIIGDIPIYVAFDSADTWAAPELFQFDESNEPTRVAGCPPDGFSATGQLWGNPLYDWEYHRNTGYEWWIRRLGYCLNLYDVVRIDHFRGFDEYYSIPYGEKTAINGEWMPGPGMDLFRAIEEKLGRPAIIAEDLGFLTPSVLKLLEDSGFPGMKVLQFAFDARESSNYLPHTYPMHCVVYTGTHDNDTTRGWYHAVGKEIRDFAKEYMCKPRLDEDTLAGDFIAMAMGSVADLCVIPMQDYLGLGSEARINTPSTLGGNWMWRMKEGQFDDKTVEEVLRVTRLYGRLP